MLISISGLLDLVMPLAINSLSIALKILRLSISLISALSIPGLKKAKVLYWLNSVSLS